VLNSLGKVSKTWLTKGNGLVAIIVVGQIRLRARS